MNIVILTGRLTADPEMKYTADGAPVASFTLAVQRNYKKGGNLVTDYISCFVPKKSSAEFCNKYLRKGTKVAVNGTWQTGSYSNKDGNKVYTNTCTVESIEFAESRRHNTPAQNSEPVPPPAPEIPSMPDYDPDLPFS